MEPDCGRKIKFKTCLYILTITATIALTFSPQEDNKNLHILYMYI